MSDFSLKALKGGIREYINILISIYYLYDNKSNIGYLNELYNELENVDNYKDLDIIKKNIIKIQDETTIDLNNKIVSDGSKLNRELTSREIGLIDRGYSYEDIINICGYSDEQFKIIADVIISDISNGCSKVKNPTCIFVGGQPGCGKSTNSIKLRESFLNDGAIEIGIDNFRSYHPNYLQMEKIINEHWVNKIPSENDSPGNDIADFTHKFAGDMTDYLVDYFIYNNDKYNLIIEWGMRTPDEPLKMMKILKNIGYYNIVNFVVVDKKSSYDACVLRADAMDGLAHITRRIPKYFHDLCVKTLPDSCNKIFEDGYINNNYIDQFVLISRDGDIIWDSNCNNKPGDIYNIYLNK